MKKRTEALMITLVLSGSAIVAAAMSGDGSEEPGAAEMEAPAPEQRGTPVVYDVDIPPEALDDDQADQAATRYP